MKDARIKKGLVSKLRVAWYRLRIGTFASGLRSQYGVVFPQFCLDASQDYRLFRQFRRHPVYQSVLEHITDEFGAAYWAELQKSPEIVARLAELKDNDGQGGPRLVHYEGAGLVAPTTLRYAKVLADLARLFGDLRGMRICEIGVGYGGQCRVINAYFEPREYWLVDLKPVLMLAQRYLDCYVLPATIRYRTMNELADRDYDLVVSNYAFSELPRELQEVYVKRVIRRARRGYLTINELAPPEFNSFTRDELLQVVPGGTILEERPSPHPRNYILAWGM